MTSKTNEFMRAEQRKEIARKKAEEMKQAVGSYVDAYLRYSPESVRD